MLSGKDVCPVQFASFTRLGREDFLLSDAQTKDYLTHSELGLPPACRTDTIFEAIIHDCAGLLGDCIYVLGLLRLLSPKKMHCQTQF